MVKRTNLIYDFRTFSLKRKIKRELFKPKSSEKIEIKREPKAFHQKKLFPCCFRSCLFCSIRNCVTVLWVFFNLISFVSGPGNRHQWVLAFVCMQITHVSLLCNEYFVCEANERYQLSGRHSFLSVSESKKKHEIIVIYSYAFLHSCAKKKRFSRWNRKLHGYYGLWLYGFDLLEKHTHKPFCYGTMTFIFRRVDCDIFFVCFPLFPSRQSISLFAKSNRKYSDL